MHLVSAIAPPRKLHLTCHCESHRGTTHSFTSNVVGFVELVCVDYDRVDVGTRLFFVQDAHSAAWRSLLHGRLTELVGDCLASETSRLHAHQGPRRPTSSIRALQQWRQPTTKSRFHLTYFAQVTSSLAWNLEPSQRRLAVKKPCRGRSLDLNLRTAAVAHNDRRNVWDSERRQTACACTIRHSFTSLISASRLASSAGGIRMRESSSASNHPTPIVPSPQKHESAF